MSGMLRVDRCWSCKTLKTQDLCGQTKTCEAQDLCFDAQLLFDLCRYLSHTIEDENKKKKERKEPTLEPYHAYDKPN